MRFKHYKTAFIRRYLLFFIAVGLLTKANAQVGYLRWNDLFEISLAKGVNREGIIADLGFVYEKAFINSETHKLCIEFKRTMQGNEGEWNESITYCEGSPRLTFVIGNPTQVFKMRRDLVQQFGFVDSGSHSQRRDKTFRTTLVKGHSRVETIGKYLNGKTIYFIVLTIVSEDVNADVKPYPLAPRGTEIGDAPVGTISKTIEGNYYALLIGINDYQVSKGLNPLSYPIADATMLKEVLLSNYTFESENVQLLTNPNRASLLHAFEQLRRKVTEKDNVLIYYAGHGHWDEESKAGYWLPVDAEQGSEAEWVSNNDIVTKLRVIKCRHLLVIADACFSGTLFQINRSIKTAGEISNAKVAERYQTTRSRHALTSGAKEEVPDQSIFAQLLVENLRQSPLPYLQGNYLYFQILQALESNPGFSGIKQQPQYGIIYNVGDDGKGGDFIFIRQKK
ncbi:caspase family protein [Siphonobacter sp. SORGH_AS_1065]|uniref:caspase family protein n=1 Tax=Siphonobacter sp. SORGH_AS_1065 TaxID=3041795 RepID=UPI002782D669|nr:caspase family protein [Siphonobacter sp. SORGH_AS_1065]MDQ1090162.1 hypothetical protein [Siphonobacter sp. SORGH_AS_1065]